MIRKVNSRQLAAVFVCLVCCSMLAAACSSTVSSPTPAPTSTKLPLEIASSIIYANVDNVPTRLDLIAPAQDGPWPVVVVVHGYNQNRFELESFAQAAAAQGAVVYNVDVAFTYPFSTAIERAACAVRYAHGTAADYRGDNESITLVGNSAGAAAAMVVGLAGDEFGGQCVMNDESALPDAVLGYEGPYKFAVTNYSGMINHELLEITDPELLEKINPYTHIGRNLDLKVHLIHGDDIDKFWYEFRPVESIEFQKVLEEAGYDVELTLVKGAAHTDLLNSASEGFSIALGEVMKLSEILSN